MCVRERELNVGVLILVNVSDYGSRGMYADLGCVRHINFDKSHHLQLITRMKQKLVRHLQKHFELDL